MGRYGHHNNNTRYERRDNVQKQQNYERYLEKENQIHQNKSNNHGISQDWDSSKKQPKRRFEVEQEWEQQSEQAKPSIVDRIKDKYQKYNSPDARMERRQNKIQKRTEKLNDLSYSAKKETLKASIRKSKHTSPTDFGFGFGSGATPTKSRGRSPSSGEGTVHLPRQNYDSMNRMFGIGSGGTPARQSKKPVNKWGSMDRMFGGL